MSIDGIEFLRRYLQHVLPKGFHKVRYYGIFAPSNRRLLDQLKSSLQETILTIPQPVREKIALRTTTSFTCPYCKKGTLFLMAICFRQYRAPPPCKPVINDDLSLAAWKAVNDFTVTGKVRHLHEFIDHSNRYLSLMLAIFAQICLYYALTSGRSQRKILFMIR